MCSLHTRNAACDVVPTFRTVSKKVKEPLTGAAALVGVFWQGRLKNKLGRLSSEAKQITSPVVTQSGQGFAGGKLIFRTRTNSAEAVPNRKCADFSYRQSIDINNRT